MDTIVERCAGLDVHKDTVVATVRIPGAGRRRRQETATYGTTAWQIAALGDWLARSRRHAGLDGSHRRVLEARGAPRGAELPSGLRWSPLVCRSGPVKLGQPDPGDAGEGGSSPDNAGTDRNCQTVRVRQARRDGGRLRGHPNGGRRGGRIEGLRRRCGEAAGEKLGAAPVDRNTVNVGTAPKVPSLRAVQAGSGQAHRRLMPSGWDGVLVVVRARESPVHGEGGQQVRSRGADRPGGRR